MAAKETLRKKQQGMQHLENKDAIFTNLMPLINWKEKPVIAGYYPIVHEIDDLAFLAHCHAQGLLCCLPFIVSAGLPLIFKEWQPKDVLEKGMYGIPAPEIETLTLTPDVLLIPLIAFDKNCYRLGKGGGFYDRTLEVLRKNHSILAIGLAYDGQETEQVFHEDHDQPLDLIVTPSRVIAR